MRALIIFLSLLLLGAPARASETITYTYDALGRLVAVGRAGTVNNGASAAYTYDPANNRTNVTVTGGGGGMASTKLPVTKDHSSQTAGVASGSHRK
jgi:YD repeat-containing protein